MLFPLQGVGSRQVALWWLSPASAQYLNPLGFFFLAPCPSCDTALS